MFRPYVRLLAMTAVLWLACTPSGGEIVTPPDSILVEIPDVPGTDVSADLDGDTMEPSLDVLETDTFADTHASGEDIREDIEEVGDFTETVETVVPDAGPAPPFASCSPGNPCQDSVQTTCLLMPDGKPGICVQPCLPADASACPFWQECVTVGEEPDMAVCFGVAEYGEPCSVTSGTLCDADRFEYCLDESGAVGEGRCTRFCNPGEPGCALWEECMSFSSSPGTGACFDTGPPPSCKEADCPSGLVCVAGVCMKSCQTDQQCGPTASCLEEEGEKACLPGESAAGDPCAPDYGLTCRNGQQCLTAPGTPIGFCSLPCPPGQECPLFMKCVEGQCIRVDQLDPGATLCSGQYPCEDPLRTCVPLLPETGLCLLACEPGPCAPGTTCVLGGCVPVHGIGEACSPDRGVLCEVGLTCRVDKEFDHHFGFCTLPCADGCPPDFGCVDGWCGREAGYGDECGPAVGLFCSKEPDLTCLILQKTLKRGYCTLPCSSTGQSCEPPFPGANALCVFLGDPLLCGLLCGDLGGACPDYMTCDPKNGICLF